jgi:outer membrane protein assembly factor BamB
VTAGDSIPSNDAFGEAALAPDGRIVFAPFNAGEVGAFDPTAGTDGEYTSVTAGNPVPSSNAFSGATLTPDGQVVFGPFDAGEVGVFEPGTGSEPEEVALHPLVNQ